VALVFNDIFEALMFWSRVLSDFLIKPV